MFYSNCSFPTGVFPIALPLIGSAYVRHSHTESSLFDLRFSTSEYVALKILWSKK